jgi:predicted RNA-binding protein with RPS1 domain
MKSLTIAEKSEDGKRSTVRVFTDRDIVDALEKKGVSKPIITQVLLGESVKPVTIFNLLNTTSNRLMEDLKSIATTKGQYSRAELEKKIKDYGAFANYEYPSEDGAISLSKIQTLYNNYNDEITNKFLEKDSPTKKDELTELVNKRNIMISVLEKRVREHIEEYYKNPEYKNNADKYNVEVLLEKLAKSKNVQERF